MPSVYMSLAPTGEGEQAYSLSTPMVTLNYRDLAGFLSVNSTPGPDYGRFTLLEFPSGQQYESPAQIQNDIESDNVISKALTLQRGGNSRVVLGNLLTVPVAGKVLYVEPVYTQAQGSNSFPILRPRHRGVRRRPAGLRAHARPVALKPGHRQRRLAPADPRSTSRLTKRKSPVYLRLQPNG